MANKREKQKPQILPKSPQIKPLSLLFHHLRSWQQGFQRCLSQLRDQEHQLAKWLRNHLKTFIGNLICTIFITLLGLNSPAMSIPFLSIISLHRTVSIFILPLLLLYFFRVLLLKSETKQKVGHRNHLISRPLMMVNILSYAISSFLLFMLLLISLRPGWCPSIVCPTQRLPIHPQGSHDDKLEMYPIERQSIQSRWYVIPGDPTHYRQSQLPESIGALKTDGQSSFPLYHLTLGLHNLQEGAFRHDNREGRAYHPTGGSHTAPTQCMALPFFGRPRRRQSVPSSLRGARIGTILSTKYLRFKNGYRILYSNPGETDRINIHIVSWVEADIQFAIQVTYRVNNELHGIHSN